MNNTKKIPKSIFGGIVALLGIVSAIVAMIHIDVEMLVEYGVFIYVGIDILYIVACILTGLGMLLGNRVLTGIGAFIAVPVALIKGGYAVDEFADYGYYMYRIPTLIFVIGMLVACAGFIYFGVLVLRNKWKKPALAKIMILILMALAFIAEVIYAFRFSAEGLLGEYITKWIMGNYACVSLLFLMLGIVIYVCMIGSKAPAAQTSTLGGSAYRAPQQPAFRSQTAPYDPAAFAQPAGRAQTAAYDPAAFAQPAAPSYSAPQRPAAPSYSAPQPEAAPFEPAAPVAPAYSAPQPEAAPAAPVYSAPQPEAAPVSAPAFSAPQPEAAPFEPEAPAQSKTSAMDDQAKAELISKYKELLDENVLTQEEFDAKKDQILSY